MSPFHFASGGRPRKPWVGAASALPPSSLQGAVLLDFNCRLQRCWFSASPPPRLLPGRPTMTHSFRQSLRAPAVQAAQPAPNSPAVPFSLAHRPLVCESIVGVSHFGGRQCGGALPVFKGRLGPRPLLAAGEYACDSPAVMGRSGSAFAARQQALTYGRCLLLGRGRSGAHCAVVACALLPARCLRHDRSQTMGWALSLRVGIRFPAHA